MASNCMTDRNLQSRSPKENKPSLKVNAKGPQHHLLTLILPKIQTTSIELNLLSELVRYQTGSSSSFADIVIPAQL